MKEEIINSDTMRALMEIKSIIRMIICYEERRKEEKSYEQFLYK